MSQPLWLQCLGRFALSVIDAVEIMNSERERRIRFVVQGARGYFAWNRSRNCKTSKGGDDEIAETHGEVYRCLLGERIEEG
jgi:hypothetical protein